MLKVLNARESASIPVIDLPGADSVSQESCAACLAHRPDPAPDTGYLTVDPEIVLPSPLPMEIAYYYNSNSLVKSEFGYGRTISKNLIAVASSLPATQTLVTMTRGNGQVVSYLNTGFGFAPSTFGVINQLTTVAYGGNTYLQETTPDGLSTVFPYNTSGVPTSIAYAQDAVGNMHTFAYGAGGLLSGIQDGAGRLVTFLYASGTLQTIEDWAGRLTTFAYDTNSIAGASLLTTVTGPSGCQTQYQYGGTGLLTAIINPNGYATSYVYEGDNRVVNRIIPAAGATTTYAYASGSQKIVDALGNITTNLLGPAGAIVGTIDPLNHVTTFGVSNGQIYMRQDPLGAVTTTNYDGLWNPLSTIDPLSRMTTYLRDAFGNATTLTYADGTVVTQIFGYAGSSFDTTGAKRMLQASIDQLGNRTSYSYNSRGLRTSQMDPLGNVTTWNYDTFGNQTAMINPLGNIWTYGYDLAGNKSSSMDPLGNVSSWTYDPQNRVLSQTDSLGNTATYGYDSNGNRIIAIDPLGNITTTSYNVWNKPSTVQNALGYVSTTGYDSLGRVITSIDPLGNVSTTIYDRASRAIANIDPLGYATTLGYDLASRLDSTTNPLGRTNTTVYNLAGQTIAAIDPMGDRTTNTYDIRGGKTAVMNPLGATTTIVYDAAGRTVASVDALGYRTTSLYDHASHMIAMQDARGYVSTTVYDAASRRIATINARGNFTTLTYDQANHRISQQDALGRFTTTAYDAAGRSISSLDALNYLTTYSYDGANNNLSIQDPLGNFTTSIYDALNRPYAQQDARRFLTTLVFDADGRNVALIDSNGNTTTMAFDPRGLQISQQDPLGAYTSFSYDPARNQIQRIDARGEITTYNYDADNRQTGIIYSGNSQLVTNSYDPVGRQITMQDLSGGITTYTYDLAGRQTAVVYGNLNKAITYSYDPVGNRTGLIDPDGQQTTYSYDPTGNLSSLINGLGEQTTLVYDPLNRQQQRVMANGMSVSTVYDPVGNVTAIQALTSAGVPLVIYTHTYDAIGNRLTADELTSQVTYAYDASYQLINEQRSGANAYNTTYTYDGPGNRLLKIDQASGVTTYVYNQANEQTLIAPATGAPNTISYDPNGNLLLENSGGQLTSYTWDGENRLLGVAYPAGGGFDTFSYLGDGRRYQKQLAANAVDTISIWDQQNLLIDANPASGATIDRITYASPGSWGSGKELISLSGASDSFYIGDGSNSVRALVSPAQAITDSYLYKAFGEELLVAGLTNNILRAFGMFGYQKDTASRLWVRVRPLDVVKGRWDSRDPLRLQTLLANAYDYVKNNPTNFADPSGLLTCTPASGWRCAHQTGKTCDCCQSGIGSCYGSGCKNVCTCPAFGPGWGTPKACCAPLLSKMPSCYKVCISLVGHTPPCYSEVLTCCEEIGTVGGSPIVIGIGGGDSLTCCTTANDFCGSYPGGCDQGC